MTWLFVTKRPFGSITKPEPKLVPCERRTLMLTTVGMTRRTSGAKLGGPELGEPPAGGAAAG
jgi:hypothetical protein